jgi:DNA (cytosine-5)-methyltransferase 1
MHAPPVIDLFAGPGGWDLAAEALGIRPLGIELDDAACATRAAAGLRTLQADVAELDPLMTLINNLAEQGDGPTQLWGFIASPPCQAFSMAGNGAGRAALNAYMTEIMRLAHADGPYGMNMRREWLDEQCHDPRAHLVLEPLRWTLALRPRWVALEQVEPVLPIWEATADALRIHGYHTWTGILSAEQYGVPQTRKRAILLASLDHPVSAPAPSHQRYIPPRRTDEPTESLFDAPDPERIVAPEDRHLQPWVSMAEALGWGMTARPYPVIAGGTGGGPDLEKVGGSQARQAIYDEQAAGRWAGEWRPFGHRTTSGRREDGEWQPDPAMVEMERDRGAGMSERHGDRPNRRADEPAFAITAGTSGRGARLGWRFRATNDRPNATERNHDEPAPSLTFGHNPPRWITPTHLKAGTGDHEAERAIDQPAPTLRFGARLNTVAWTSERPATTVAGDPRVHPPGHKENAQDQPGRFEQSRGENAVRVTISEALVLQSFPPDYPIAGTKTKQFEQVGNAIPPLVAHAILKHLTTGAPAP